ncbi:helix-turn-helix domain-containing protein [Staphylococcus chromogenes]|uniref:helix-turn-helix domain-containing protein n=1 Tax=Staphylococcus chromogenes TaxID=46126 RepID=UPI000D1A3676|nr:helix-turn-helix domain-containing protein [Staphylococcus chromogenes]MDT0670656.1 helix-turn-helix domain-containing protein [Staphylococcus chromogenes]PTF96717.1 DNA-binding protein [Staphylococcus chromogenes]PTG65512.1 DNA-binding protein [Staphylococcus chromogenes]PTG78682.1 DNA-binding protein [Staphylococcus chromogenes]RIM24291.1 DNA-binding protein [Staphylococcus chromogenes]
MFLTIKETAELLRCTEHNIYKLARNNEIPSVKVGGKVLIPKEQLLNQLFEGKDWN